MADGDDEQKVLAEKQAAIARVLAESDVLPKKSQVSADVIRDGQSILVKHPGEGDQAGKNVVDVFIGKSYADAAEKAISYYKKKSSNGNSMNRKQRRALAAQARKGSS